MKYILMLLCVCFFLACFVNADTKKSFEFPKAWNKDVSIEIYEGGGMRYASTTIYLSADSCKYIEMEQGVDRIKRFKLSAKEQEEVSTKLNSYDVGAIETIKTKGMVYDKETSRLCFHLNAKEDHCIETGSSTEIKPKYQDNFNKAYNYIFSLAQEKTK